MIVISLGGSTINENGKIDIKFIKNFSKIIKKEKEKFGIVTGGGFNARVYANAVRKLKGSEFEADMAGIFGTRQNAMLLISELDSYRNVITDFNEAKNAIINNKIIVMGGLIPGISTDTVSVLLAEALEAKKVINVSNVDGIYNKNPKKYKNAKKIKKMNYDELIKLATKSDSRSAGEHFIFDLLACKIAKRSKIELHFVGKNIDEIRKAIKGKKHNGTIVR